MFIIKKTGNFSYYSGKNKHVWFIHFALDEIADNLVVEVLNSSPLDALLHILLLKKGDARRVLSHTT